MNRVTRGTVVLAAALVVLSCEGDPTGDLRNGADHLVATPSAILLSSDDTTAVLVEVVDKQGNRLEASWSLGNVDPGLAVERDTLYNLVYDNQGNQVLPKKWPRARYYISATANTGDLTFTVSAGGKSIDVPVRIVPAAGIPTATLSTKNVAAYTDTISASLPFPFRFQPNSAVKFTGVTPNAHFVGISADSSIIYFVANPGMTAKTATFSHVKLAYSTTAAFETSVTSGVDSVTTLGVPPVFLSKSAAAIGDTITLSAPVGWSFTPGKSVPTVTGAGLASLGVSADSATLRFIIGPSANAVVNVTNMKILGAPNLGVYTLSSTAVLTSPGVANFPGTLSNASPAPGGAVTITAGAGWKFLPTARLTHGSGTGIPVAIISRAADSSSITFIPAPNAPVGLLYADNIVLDFLTSVAINDLPNTVSITPPAPLYTGTGAFATAPTVTMPTAGNSVDIVDLGTFISSSDCDNQAGGFDCRIYKFTIGTTVTLSFSNTWSNTTDLGLYFSDDTESDLGLYCDSKGAGAGGQPEVCSMSFAPGTYYMQMTTYSPFYAPPNDVDPYWFRINVIGS